ncbi:hypothetical protein BHE90_001635 [Fusarium euwallaceae]|uniref:Xylanolytic transcriptional activator regulatory domain-containing protein n=1 Tax=Fusarium euwallaceae TaxID=1147111 RepID=A0A430M7B7_9HYPO|nr:hypothetical protein BHE90_001635 [Fusarium euwallaceae]
MAPESSFSSNAPAQPNHGQQALRIPSDLALILDDAGSTPPGPQDGPPAKKRSRTTTDYTHRKRVPARCVYGENDSPQPPSPTGHDAESEGSDQKIIARLDEIKDMIGREFLLEIDLPPSGLGDLSYPDPLPEPPLTFATLGADVETKALSPTNYDSRFEERGWCYYLAEISLRRTIDDTLQHLAEGGEKSWLSNPSQLIRQYHELEKQRSLWRFHLPTIVQFDDEQVPDNEFAFGLRGRFLEWNELLLRPILYHVLHLPSDQTPLQECVELAEKAIHLCEQKIYEYQHTLRHGGSWFITRRIFAYACLILAAAMQPERRIKLPARWGSAIRVAIQALGFWSQDAADSRWDAVLCRPPVEPTPPAPTDVPFTLSFGPSKPVPELLAALPPDPVCEYLVTRYFATLSPLFHILHGPTFQKQYWAFLQNPQQADLSWLALLYAICGLTLKTVPPTDPGLSELWEDSSTPRDLSSLSLKCREAAMMCLSQDQFLVRHNLNTLEALLILIHTIANTEGAEYGWVLLGNALHIAIALRCHINGDASNFIERERRRRCWAGILILHTDQTLLYRDIDLSSLANMKASMPSDANDDEIQEHAILTSPAQASSRRITHMSLIRFHFQLFQLSTRVHSHVSGPNQLNEAALGPFDAEISEQQQQWDSLYLVNGARSILDTAGYAHWCILQTYAHQLYLLLHRPFHHSRSSCFRPESRDRCAQSGLALLDIHRQFFQLPRLKCYRWLVNGTISCNALHGAVALTSCLVDMPNDADFTEHLAVIDAAVVRLECLKRKSPACSHIYPILRCLQLRLSRASPPSPARELAESRFEDWVSNVDWFRPDAIDWDFWDGDFSTPQADDDLTATT